MHFAIAFFTITFLAILNKTAPRQPPPFVIKSNNTHFVLVHGGGHGAWSWFKLTDLLRSRGHHVTAIDLAASGIDPTPITQIYSLSDYFRPLMDFMAALPRQKPVVMVGHSFGGYAVSKAVEMFPNKITVAVFVTALMPGPSFNVSTINNEVARRLVVLLDSHYEYGNGPNKPPTTFIMGPKYLARFMYQNSPKQDWLLANMLVRPHPVFTEMEKEMVLSKHRYGSVKRVFVISGQDLVIPEDFQRWMIHRNPPNGVLLITGSDHMVMLSYPIQLSLHLQFIAATYR